MNKHAFRFPAVAAFVLAAASAQAATLATWSLKNNATAGVTEYTEALAPADIVAGPDVKNAAPGANGYSGTGWPTGQAYGSGAYFEFSVTATEDYYLNLDKLSMNLRSSGTGPAHVTVRWSEGGETWTDLAEFGHSPDTKVHPYEVDAHDVVVHGGKTVSFRVYGWGGSGASGTFRADTVELVGTPVGTKEPPTIVFPSEAVSVPVSNTLAVAIGVLPDGVIASWSFTPPPQGGFSLVDKTFAFTPAAADEKGVFTLSVTASNGNGQTTAALPVSVTEYMPPGAWSTGFETGENPANATADWTIDGRTWSIQQLTFSDSDLIPKIGNRACVFGTYNESYMVSDGKLLDSEHGFGSVSFWYAAHPSDSEPCQPLVVEITTDLALGDWMEIGRVNATGVEEMTRAEFELGTSEPVYLRLRNEYINGSGRICIDQLMVLPFTPPAWNPFETYLLKYNVTPGDPGCASQNFWADGEDANSYMTDDFDEDGYSNWAEYQASPRTNPYDKTSHP